MHCGCAAGCIVECNVGCIVETYIGFTVEAHLGCTVGCDVECTTGCSVEPHLGCTVDCITVLTIPHLEVDGITGRICCNSQYCQSHMWEGME